MMFLFYVLYFIRYVYPARLSINRNEELGFKYTKEQQTIIKERLYSYIQSYDENETTLKSRIIRAMHLFTGPKKPSYEMSFVKITKELKISDNNQFYQFSRKEKNRYI